IPQYSYQAAAITTILSELVLFVGFAYLMQTGVGRLDWPTMLWKPYVAAVAMGGFVWLIAPFTGSFIAVFAGGLVYIMVLLALKPLDADELARVSPALPRRARWLFSTV